jgi:hypothetical protein
MKDRTFFDGLSTLARNEPYQVGKKLGGIGTKERPVDLIVGHQEKTSKTRLRLLRKAEWTKTSFL